MHNHDHHDHGHDHALPDDRRRLVAALLLTGSFMVVEAVGGWIAGSLALIADAAHMLTDTASLLFAWIAFRITDRPADRKRTFGYHRFPVLAEKMYTGLLVHHRLLCASTGYKKTERCTVIVFNSILG